jgi:hypothetical protein
MSSVRFNARLDTSHHRTPHAFKDAAVVAGKLSGIHKHLCVVNRSCIHKVFYCDIGRQKYVGAPSRMSHIRPLTASGTSVSGNIRNACEGEPRVLSSRQLLPYQKYWSDQQCWWRWDRLKAKLRGRRLQSSEEVVKAHRILGQLIRILSMADCDVCFRCNKITPDVITVRSPNTPSWLHKASGSLDECTTKRNGNSRLAHASWLDN